MKISVICPCRNNLKYFKWAYDSIRRNQGNHEVFICAADDASTDGTKEAFQALCEIDSHFDYIVNEGPERVGHTILYDRIVNELVKTDIAIIFHADMYLCPGALDEIQKLMYDIKDHTPVGNPGYEIIDGQKIEYGVSVSTNDKTIVSLTRIEPPLHPDGSEKYLADWGVEPEQFNEDAFLQWFTSGGSNGYKPKHDPPYTTGIFAPWAFFVKDFKEIGGHDPLFRPQSKEDSDIFNRFKLNGVKFIQTWLGCVYHMTCRGSRFNPTLTTPGKNSQEWEEHNVKSARNFLRKWGCYVEHTPLMDPIVYGRYEVDYRVKNSTLNLISRLEPYCDSLRTDLSLSALQSYLAEEQKNTDFDLGYKISGNVLPSFVVYIDGNKINAEDFIVLHNLQKMLHDQIDSLEVGKNYVVGNLDILCLKKENHINKLINISDKFYKTKLRSK